MNNSIIPSSRIPGRYYALENDDDVQIVRREVRYVERDSGPSFGTVLGGLIVGAIIVGAICAIVDESK